MDSYFLILNTPNLYKLNYNSPRDAFLTDDVLRSHGKHRFNIRRQYLPILHPFSAGNKNIVYGMRLDTHLFLQFPHI